MTNAVNLEVHYHNQIIPLHFYIINLGSDEMLLGMPFLATYNLEINWQDRTFSRDIFALTDNTHQWSSDKYKTYDPEIEEEDLDNQDYKFIPSNKCDIVTIEKAITAIELAIQAVDQIKHTWQEQVPEPYHQFGRVFSNKESQRFSKSRP
jgi:hypothetical protein